MFVCDSDDNDAQDVPMPVVVHQTKWQQALLRRYGQLITLIDATHNTTIYAMPLFMLCVATNSGYMVVGTFLAGDEQSATIASGLRVIASWCPDWNPQYIMSDFSEAQISAVEAVFPRMLVLISCVCVLCNTNNFYSSVAEE